MPASAQSGLKLALLAVHAGSQNPKALAKFALSYMTSIGHTYGSAPMGKVVDDKFQVMGVNGLSIVDASVLPQLTRMNPVYTIMALGRYVLKPLAACTIVSSCVCRKQHLFV